jgi:hypothetical protein
VKKPAFAPISSAALALCTLALAACAWSVPADPGKNAARRARVVPRTGPAPGVAFVPEAPPAAANAAAGDDDARQTYLAHCSRCHEAFPPAHATADEWPGLVRRYAPRAGLFGADRDRVLRWLQANAR